MSTTKLVSGSSVKNNGGTIYGVPASATAGVVTASVGYGRTGGPFGSTVVSGVGLGRQKFNSAGNFAKLVAGEYIVMGASTKIAGQTSDSIKYPGTSIGQRKNLAYRTTRKSYIPLWYDYLTGTNSGVISDDEFGDFDGLSRNVDDEASNAGRAWNGEFTHMLTGATPKLYDYPVKTG